MRDRPRPPFFPLGGQRCAHKTSSLYYSTAAPSLKGSQGKTFVCKKLKFISIFAKSPREMQGERPLSGRAAKRVQKAGQTGLGAAVPLPSPLGTAVEGGRVPPGRATGKATAPESAHREISPATDPKREHQGTPVPGALLRPPKGPPDLLTRNRRGPNRSFEPSPTRLSALVPANLFQLDGVVLLRCLFG